MKKRFLIEQDAVEKMPGMTLYDPGNPLETKEKPQGGGLSGTPTQETPKKIDLVDARDNKKCPRLQNTTYIIPKGGGDGVLKKEAPEDSPKGLYKKGDLIFYKNDKTFDVYTTTGKLVTGNQWSCKALTPEPIKKEEPKAKFSTDQQSIINYQIEKQQKVEACNDISNENFKDRCAPIAQIGMGEYTEFDMSDSYPKYFKPNEKIIYFRKSASQEYSGSKMNDLIKSYKEKSLWKTTDEIKPDQLFKYWGHNLRDLHPDIFKQDFFMYEEFTDIDCDKLKTKMTGPEGKINFNSVSRGDCKKAIDLLYTFYVKNCDMETTLKEQLKRYAKQCATQKNFGKRTDGLLDILRNISKNEPDQRKRSFSLAESKISLKQSIHESLKEIKILKESVKNRNKTIKQSIHETLLNIKEQKRINSLENEIMKKRIDFVVESYRKSKSFDKFLRDVIYEFDYMSKQNFGKSLLSEATSEDNLLNYLGRKVANAPEMLVNKLVSKIAEKMDAGQGSWWVDKVTSEFMKDEDISVPKILELDCSYIVSKFSKTFERILKDKTQTAPDGMIELVKSSLDGAIENYFKSDFEKELKSKICPIVSSFASKLKDTEEMLNKKLVSQEPSGSDRLNAPVTGEFGS